jgi:hypothetical protein
VRRDLGLALFIVVMVSGCASMADVRPGDGKVLIIRDRSYEDIWEAAVQVAREHFEIREQDKAKGTIRAERTAHFNSWGEWVGIFVTPTMPDANRYRVEVVSRRKSRGQISGQGWEGKTLRDLRDVLDGRPIR